jgi:hypothetical protein
VNERESSVERKVAPRRDLCSVVILCDGASFKASRPILRSNGKVMISIVIRDRAMFGDYRRIGLGLV